MSYQTCGALREFKLDNWLSKGVITKKEYLKTINICNEFGFWDALGFATRMKYKHLLRKKYKYLWLTIEKKHALKMDYVTTGGFSLKGQKHRRVWYNYYFDENQKERYKLTTKLYPGWEIFYTSQSRPLIGLRREIG